MTSRSVGIPAPRRSSNGHGPTMPTGPVAVLDRSGLTHPVDPPAPVPEAVAARRQSARLAEPVVLHGLVLAVVLLGLGAATVGLMLAGVVRASESTATPVALVIVAVANVAGWGAGRAALRRRRAGGVSQ